MTAASDTAIPFAMVEAAFGSEHLAALASGSNTHDAALRASAQLVRFTRDASWILDVVRSALPLTYDGNSLDELPGMVADAIKNGFGDPPPHAPKSDAKMSEKFLHQLGANGIELFHEAKQEGFIAITQNGGGRLNFPIRSESIRNWLRLKYFEANRGKPIAQQALAETVDTLEAQAIYRGPLCEVHLRIGAMDDEVFIDLGRADARVVRIGPDGWDVTTDCPIRFRRSPGFGELPEPTRDGDLKCLRKLLGLGEENWVLLLAFLINCLKPSGPYMLLLVEGEQGSGKSILCSLVKQLIDPNEVERLRLPKTEHDLAIQANENHLLVYDNTSSVKWDMSDALAALATGSGFSTRKYYTDNESRTFKHCRCSMLNGIGSFANYADLQERSSQLKLPTMPPAARKTEREFWETFNEIRAGVFGCLCDAVAHALKFRDKVEAPSGVRMADAAQWIVAAEPALGLIQGTFARALQRSQLDMMVEKAVNDPLVIVILEIVEKEPHKVFNGTVGRLWSRIQPDPIRRDRRLPATPAHLSNALQRLKPVMAKIDLEVEFGQKTRKGKPVRIWINDEDRKPGGKDEF